MNDIYGILEFCVLLVVVFFSLNRVLAKGYLKDGEKTSPYECGFEPLGFTRVSFSLRFFLVGVIFLIFDLEIVLIFPFVFSVEFGFDWLLYFSYFVFLLVLSIGLAHECNEGSLDWKEW